MGVIHSLTIRLSERYKENEWMNSVYAFCIESIFIKYGTLRSFLTSLCLIRKSLDTIFTITKVTSYDK